MARARRAAIKLACVQLELEERRRVYPYLMKEGNISWEFARLQIALMEEIVEDYRKLAEAEATQ